MSRTPPTRAEAVADLLSLTVEVERCLDITSAATDMTDVRDDDAALRALSSKLGRLNECLSSIMLNVDLARGMATALIQPSRLPAAPVAKAQPKEAPPFEFDGACSVCGELGVAMVGGMHRGCVADSGNRLVEAVDGEKALVRLPGGER